MPSRYEPRIDVAAIDAIDVHTHIEADEHHRVGVPELDPSTAGEASPDPGLARVKKRHDPEFFEGRIQRVERPRVGLEALQAWVELEAADAEFSRQAMRLPDGGFPVPWVDRTERDQDVRVSCSPLGDLFARKRGMAGGS